MAEKIRPPHLPPTSASSQQPLLVPPAPAESSQAVMSLPKLQQVPGLHPQAVPQPDVALHARPATSTVTGRPGSGGRWGQESSEGPVRRLPFPAGHLCVAPSIHSETGLTGVWLSKLAVAMVNAG